MKKYDKIKIEYKEVANSIKQIRNLTADKAPKIVYIPPVIPCINSCDIFTQSESAINYYKTAGVKKVVVQSVDICKKYVIVLFKSNDVSKKYFHSDSIGDIYSQNNHIADMEKQNILTGYIMISHHQDTLSIQGLISLYLKL
jgi:DNA repair photolyase